MANDERDIIDVLGEKIDKSVAALRENLNTIRAGRANPALLDKVLVDYYGSQTPLKNMANIAAPDPRSLVVTPFDPKTLGEVEKAIETAEIGLSASNDGRAVRLKLAELTEDRRKELTKLVKKFGEDAKVAVRNERRACNEVLKKQEKDGELTEDDLENEEKKAQKKADEAVSAIEKLVEAKEKEILEI